MSNLHLTIHKNSIDTWSFNAPYSLLGKEGVCAYVMVYKQMVPAQYGPRKEAKDYVYVLQLNYSNGIKMYLDNFERLWT